MKVSNIRPNGVYFDPKLVDAKLLIQSYEFLGMDGDEYVFQALDPFCGPGTHRPSDSKIYDGTIALTPKQIERLLDLDGLVERLLRIRDERAKGGRSPLR